MFVRETGAGYKLLALIVASCVLVVADARTRLLETVSVALDTVVAPLYAAARFPHQVGSQVAEVFSSRSRLLRRNAELERDLLKMKGIVARYEGILDKNERLQKLLDASAQRTQLRSDMLIADVVQASTDRLEVVIDKGRMHGIEVGQAVIDSEGVFGQVVESAALTSRVLLIADARHSLPVRVLRNNVRTIAAGNGQDRLSLKHVAVTLDIVEGDQLVTSGLGDRFPPDFRVGEVESVVRDQTQPFADIIVLPFAELDRSRQVLVVFAERPEEAGPQQAAAEDLSATNYESPAEAAP